jgi:hypothetical protein
MSNGWTPRSLLTSSWGVDGAWVLVFRDRLFQVTVVNTNVLVKVSFLGESLATILVIALKWSFPGVRTQVVKKVVPFTEDHVAVGEVALHNPNSALGLLVLETEHSETLGLGDVVVVNVDVIEVDIFAQVNFDVLVVQNALQEIFISLLLQGRLFAEVHRQNHTLLLNIVVKEWFHGVRLLARLRNWDRGFPGTGEGFEILAKAFFFRILTHEKLENGGLGVK